MSGPDVDRNSRSHSSLVRVSHYGFRAESAPGGRQTRGSGTDLFYDINGLFLERGLKRLEEMLRPAAMSGLISDLLTASLANHARGLTENRYFNGHPDLIVAGFYPNDSVQAGSEGIEIKSTRKKGGAVDTHGAREQWMCVFVHEVDTETEPARNRRPMSFTEVCPAQSGASRSRPGTRRARPWDGPRRASS